MAKKVSLINGVMIARAALRCTDVEFDFPTWLSPKHISCPNCFRSMEYIVRNDEFHGFCESCGTGWEVRHVWIDEVRS